MNAISAIDDCIDTIEHSLEMAFLELDTKLAAILPSKQFYNFKYDPALRAHSRLLLTLSSERNNLKVAVTALVKGDAELSSTVRKDYETQRTVARTPGLERCRCLDCKFVPIH